METIPVNGLTLIFDTDEKDTAEIIRRACEQSIPHIHKYTGLDTPKDCRIYVMTSWFQFFFHSTPWYWRILLILSMPLWILRVRKIWEYAGGWTQRYGKRCAVGVKPPRLVRMGDKSIGERIFIKEENIETKLQMVTCHELVHAFTSYLKLPMWLNEGLAQVIVDRVFNKSTVIYDTVEILDKRAHYSNPGRYRKLRIEDKDMLIYHYVRGYWITRYIKETQPELLKSLLSQHYSHRMLESKVASAYGMKLKDFWQKIDGIVVSYFSKFQ
jgi:hypothetical protein